MIFDTIDQLGRYKSLGKNIAAAVDYLLNTDLASLPVGRVEIDGERLYALVQEYTTKTAGQGVWEAHRRYIDIQFVQRGQERMGFASLGKMQLGAYLPEKDFQAMNGTGNTVDVFEGAFVIFFPEDAHMPGLSVDTPEEVRKIVLKVRVEEA